MVRMARSPGASVAPRGGDLLPPHRRRPSRRPGQKQRTGAAGGGVDGRRLHPRGAQHRQHVAGRESFDYGPFAFLEGWDRFSAAYFDHSGLYAYDQQPLICHHNQRLLQEPLAMLLRELS